MKKGYFYPLLLFVFVSATELSIKKDLWNFKDYDKIEYDFSMSAFNEVNYLNRNNGVKVSANLIVDVLDSTYANVVLINKKIIEKVNDSITTYDEIQLKDDIIFERYTNQGKVEGRISDEADAIKDVLFPVLSKEIKVGESIIENFIIPFDLGNKVIELEVENVISKTKSENGINTYLSEITSAKYPVENPVIESMHVFVNGNSNFQFDNKRGVFLGQKTNLNFYIKGTMDYTDSSDMFTFRINQDIQLKSLK